jgi:hypothetical protein
MIEFDVMVRKLSKQGNLIAQSLTPQKAAAWHHSSCLMGEAGELLEGLGDHENIIEELGDLEFYMEGLRDAIGISFETVIESISEMRTVCRLGYIEGIVVESCKVFDATKKWIIYEQDLNRAKLTEAMARYEFYMACFRGSRDISRIEVLAANQTKLAKRYGANFEYTNAAAQKRADKQP